MIELPEALTLASQLNAEISNKTVSRVFPPTKLHKFCWFNGEPEAYEKTVAGTAVSSAEAFGSHAELSFANGKKLCINDGVNVRLTEVSKAPKDYQLLMAFTDDTALAFTVAMYGGIVLHDGDYDNTYYIKSLNYVSPFSPEFSEYYENILSQCKKTISAKAFLATEQRFPGIGNGTAQDILFNAWIHPKQKIKLLEKNDLNRLFESIVSTLHDMTSNGGRNTEKDIYGNPGRYETKMSKLAKSCPICGGEIIKENYLGGSVYYCEHCQPC